MAYEHNGEDGVFTESVLAATAEPEEDEVSDEAGYEPFAEGEDPLAEEDLFADLDLAEDDDAAVEPDLAIVGTGAMATVGSDEDLEARLEKLETAARELAAAEITREGRRVRRKVVRGVDRVEEKLADLETLYDLVHGEVEDAALDVAATLRSVRRGNGMLGRVRRLLVAGRS